MASDTPDYLEPADNEDSEAVCPYCGEDAWDDGRYPDLCHACNEEAAEEEYWERVAEDRADRALDDDREWE